MTVFSYVLGTSIDLRSCASESFLTDPPTEDVRNLVNRGQRDFSVNIIKSLFSKHQSGTIHGRIVPLLALHIIYIYICICVFNHPQL